MKRHDDIDFSKLLGFDAVSDQISGSVDFQDEPIGAKLGAKVGTPELIIEMAGEYVGAVRDRVS
jgi:hypothetical protein